MVAALPDSAPAWNSPSKVEFAFNEQVLPQICRISELVSELAAVPALLVQLPLLSANKLVLFAGFCLNPYVSAWTAIGKAKSASAAKAFPAASATAVRLPPPRDISTRPAVADRLIWLDLTAFVAFIVFSVVERVGVLVFRVDVVDCAGLDQRTLPGRCNGLWRADA